MNSGSVDRGSGVLTRVESLLKDSRGSVKMMTGGS